MAEKFGVRPKPTPQQIERARELRAAKMHWSEIGRIIDCSTFLLRCEIEPGYKEKRRKQISDRWKQYGPRRPKEDIWHRVGHSSVGQYETSPSIPAIVEEKRNRLASYQHTDLTAAYFGDPPPFRSALGKKNGWQ